MMRIVLVLILLVVSSAAQAANLRFQAGQDGFSVAPSDLVCVRQIFNNGRVAIEIKLSPGLAAKLAKLTKRNLHKKMEIAKDGKKLQSAIIMSAMTKGRLILEGAFSIDEARAIVRDLGGPRGPCEAVRPAPKTK